MEFGASIFFTDYSITPAELAVALEERGFDSVWAAEHSHIPVPRRTRADSELGKRYYDVMDPFVTLTAAACATKRLKSRPASLTRFVRTIFPHKPPANQRSRLPPRRAVSK